MNKLFRLFPLLLLISGICFYPVTSVFAENLNNTDETEIDITISPKDNLFNLDNMKPGDWAPRTITVQNSGTKDFVYQMELRNNGETKLYEGLMLEIKAGEKELYEGKLADFKSLDARELVSGSEENLEMTIRFPKNLGNEYQGLDSSFEFIFTAEGEERNSAVQAVAKGQVGSDGSGSSLPSTATNIFTLILIGSVLLVGGIALLISRHYRQINLAQ